MGKLMFILTKSNPFSTSQFFPIMRQPSGEDNHLPSSDLYLQLGPTIPHVPGTVTHGKDRTVTTASHPISFSQLFTTGRFAQLFAYLVLVFRTSRSNNNNKKEDPWQK
jgi:hypothetical protein